MQPLVSISIVTWNSLSYIERCLEHLHQQRGIILEVIISDNNSTDGTLEFLESQNNIKVIAHKTNTGFCYAHNHAIENSSGEFILILNPDVFLEPTYISELLSIIQINNRIGQATGKLYRITSLDEIGESKIIDSTGLFFTKNQRHFDRGAGEIDFGQYDHQEYIFGVCGAAALYRREALFDSALSDEFFDEDFFAYREDADLSWRMQLFGWKAVYAPSAIAYHVRGLKSNDDRKSVSSNINMHSVKNRFLMRIKNQTLMNFFCNAVKLIWRDLQVVGYILLIEHTSLPAFGYLVKLFPKTLNKRCQVMSRKKVTEKYILQWFAEQPISFPIE